jgi:Peptidase family S41
MNTNFLARATVFVLMGMGCAMAQPRIPNTPAGHTLGAWLEAFNSGDRARMESYVRTFGPGHDADGIIAARRSSGGFDLLAILRSEPLHIWFLARERFGGTRVVGDLRVRAGTPARVEFFWSSALPPGVSPAVVKLDSALRARVIDGLAADLTRFYVHPAVAAQMVGTLRAQEHAEAYRGLDDGFQFADRLTADLRGVSHDLHLRVTFNPFERPPPARPTAQQLARMRSQMERGNCAFEKVEILPGDVGYVKFDAFMSPEICAATVEAAMAFVAHTRALIFDLRDNGGGQPAMIAFIASYLFDRPTHLNDIYNRYRNTTTQFWTIPSLPGKRLSREPVFVLTSHRTFSGAEEFCYDLENLRRATIVGETTGGGAHPVRGYAVADYFQVVVPGSEAINPITHTNWEGTGVQPDVKVPAADALTVAVRLVSADLQAAAASRRPTEGQERPRTAPSPGTEASLRRQIEGWERGQPDYDDMGPGLQEAALQQRVQIQGMFARLGALRSLRFVRVARGGWDVYEAKFAHGGLQCSIAPLSADGRADGVFLRLLTGSGLEPPPPR